MPTPGTMEQASPKFPDHWVHQRLRQWAAPWGPRQNLWKPISSLRTRRAHLPNYLSAWNGTSAVSESTQVAATVYEHNTRPGSLEASVLPGRKVRYFLEAVLTFSNQQSSVCFLKFRVLALSYWSRCSFSAFWVYYILLFCLFILLFLRAWYWNSN